MLRMPDHPSERTPMTEPDPQLRGWPRRPQRLATGVVEDLVDRIVGGELAAGTALPTEPVLCELFAVSRTVIREAVKTLEAMRLVTVQQGHGTTVRQVEDWNLLNPTVLAASVRHDAEMSVLEDVVDVRRALEGNMAGLAAVRADAEDLRRIEEALRQLHSEELDEARYLRADLAFHDAIMVASGNRLGRAVIQTINAEAFQSLRYIGEPTPEDLTASNAEHQAVYERIAARDEKGAARAMSDHILRSWRKRRPKTSDTRGRPNHTRWS